MNEHIGPTKEQFKDWMAMWHVEIEERARHLSPDKWTITGWYVYEKYLYNNAEYKWQKEETRLWREKYGLKEGKEVSLETLANSDILNCGEDYFHWHVETPGWSLHKDGIWRKMLISDGEYTGIYDSYEEAVTTLAKLPVWPLRFEDYEEYLQKESWHYKT